MRPDVVLIGVTLLWGSTFVVTKDALPHVGPFAFLTLRFAVGALVLAALLRRRRLSPTRSKLGTRRITRRALHDGVVLALLNSTALVFQVFGQLYTTASKSAFVTSINTPLTPLMALAIYRMLPTRPQ